MTNPENDAAGPASSLLSRYDDWVNRKLGLPPLKPGLAGHLRAAQADMFIRVLPPILISNVLSAAVIACAALHHSWLWFRVPWIGCAAVTGLMGVRQMRKVRSPPRDKQPSPQFIDRILIDSALMALPWVSCRSCSTRPSRRRWRC